MSRPRLSVILPAYNAAAFIRVAVESILAQTYDDFELILIEDGSTDDTAAILKTFSDSRMRLVVHEENKGFAASLNDGIAGARGEFLARHDADDWSHPERFAEQVAYLDAHPKVGLLGTWYDKVDEAGVFLVERRMPVSDTEIRATLERGNPFCHGSVMLRRACYDRVGNYREMVGPTEDIDLWLRLSEVTQMANLERALYSLRTNYSSMMAATRLQEASAVRVWIRAIAARRRETGVDPLEAGEAKLLAERDRLRERWGKLRPPSEAYRRARHAFILAEDHLRNGDLKAAITCNLRAIKQYPFWWAAWRLLGGLLRKRIAGGE